MLSMHAETTFGRRAVQLLTLLAALVFVTGTGHAQDLSLTPRVPLAKIPSVRLEMPDTCTGRLRVKFMDGLRARPAINGRVYSLSNVALPRVDDVFNRFGLTAVPAFSDADKINAVLERAERLSGNAQPDLEGIMYVSGPVDALERAARALNDLPNVEWVTFDTVSQQAQWSKRTRPSGRSDKLFGDPTDGGAGACCTPDGATCTVEVEFVCIASGGVFGGGGTTCAGTPCQGACCTAGACTTENDAATCTGGGGTWLGALTECMNADCGPPIMSGKCCQPEGGVSNCMITMNEADCVAAGGIYGGDGTDCSAANACAGACCAAGTNACVVRDSEVVCLNLGGSWNGALQACDITAFCFNSEGRCCMSEGSVSSCTMQQNEGDCIILGGFFGGPGTDCSDSGSCSGACCLGTTCTQENDETTCLGLGATVWFGPGTICDFPCDTAGKCCGFDGQTCIQTDTEAACLAIDGGIFGGPGTTCSDTDPCVGACCMSTAVNPPPTAGSEPACLAMGGRWQGSLSSPATTRCSSCCLPSNACIVTGPQRCGVAMGQWRDSVPGGDGDTCPVDGCGACCTGSMALPCREGYTSASCLALPAMGAFPQYDGAGTTCGIASCGEGDACCLMDGTCTPLDPDSCIIGMGVPFPGGNCDFLNCAIRVCCLPGNECALLREDECSSAGGTFDSSVSSCDGVECEDQCGSPSAGNCYAAQGNGTPYCNRTLCCNFICNQDPFCCDEEEGMWDTLCADQANLAPAVLCGEYTPHCPDVGPEIAGPDPCQSALAGSCFSENSASKGCNSPDCCTLVCSIRPFCCTLGWDAVCAAIALTQCISAPPPSGTTPDYSSFQAYKTGTSFDLFQVPPTLKEFLPIVDTPPAGFTICDNQIPIDQTLALGFNGEGMNLSSRGENFTDTNGNGFWDTGEPFEDVGDGVFRPAEPFVDDGTDTIPGTMDCDGSEGNGLFDSAEVFSDINLNGIWDPGEPWIDENCNATYDTGEFFTDLNSNGAYDGTNDVWDSATQDVGLDGIAGSGDIGFGEGDGTWTPPEAFVDFNNNGVWDAGIDPLDDRNLNGIRDPGEPFTDSGNLIWDPPGGLVGIAEQLLNGPVPVDATGLGNITDGRTSRIGVIDDAYWQGHEDLTNTIPEPGQTMILIDELTNPDHGTAVLGIVSAVDNGIGITGIAPAATSYFFPTVSIEEGSRELAAWLSAIAIFEAGDVLVSSQTKLPPVYTLNGDPSLATLFRVARDLGISVCVAAGNQCANLDVGFDFGDTGAMVVGATSPGAPHFRLRDSNYCTQPTLDRGNIVHVNAWGENVVTTGFGTLQLPGGDVNRSYTAVFGGTSAATPQIGGLVAMMQGLAKQFYGIPLTPNQIRQALDAPGRFGTPQRLLINAGFNPGLGCGVDVDPEQEPSRAGSFPDIDRIAFRMFVDATAPFADAPLVEDVVVVRGANPRGNRFAIKGRDQSFLEVDEVSVDPTIPVGAMGSTGIGGGLVGGTIVPQVSQLEYVSAGNMTDIVIIARSDIDDIGTLLVENAMRWPPVFGVLVIEGYDWQLGDWSFIDFQAGQFGGDQTFIHTAGSPARFVNPADNRILIRHWFLGFPALSGFSTGGATSFTTRLDLINVFVAEEFGVPLP